MLTFNEFKAAWSQPQFVEEERLEIVKKAVGGMSVDVRRAIISFLTEKPFGWKRNRLQTYISTLTQTNNFIEWFKVFIELEAYDNVFQWVFGGFGRFDPHYAIDACIFLKKLYPNNSTNIDKFLLGALHDNKALVCTTTPDEFINIYLDWFATLDESATPLIAELLPSWLLQIRTWTCDIRRGWAYNSDIRVPLFNTISVPLFKKIIDTYLNRKIDTSSLFNFLIQSKKFHDQIFSWIAKVLSNSTKSRCTLSAFIPVLEYLVSLFPELSPEEKYQVAGFERLQGKLERDDDFSEHSIKGLVLELLVAPSTTCTMTKFLFEKTNVFSTIGNKNLVLDLQISLKKSTNKQDIIIYNAIKKDYMSRALMDIDNSEKVEHLDKVLEIYSQEDIVNFVFDKSLFGIMLVLLNYPQFAQAIYKIFPDRIQTPKLFELLDVSTFAVIEQLMSKVKTEARPSYDKWLLTLLKGDDQSKNDVDQEKNFRLLARLIVINVFFMSNDIPLMLSVFPRQNETLKEAGYNLSDFLNDFSLGKIRTLYFRSLPSLPEWNCKIPLIEHLTSRIRKEVNEKAALEREQLESEKRKQAIDEARLELEQLEQLSEFYPMILQPSTFKPELLTSLAVDPLLMIQAFYKTNNGLLSKITTFLMASHYSRRIYTILFTPELLGQCLVWLMEVSKHEKLPPEFFESVEALVFSSALHLKSAMDYPWLEYAFDKTTPIGTFMHRNARKGFFGYNPANELEKNFNTKLEKMKSQFQWIAYLRSLDNFKEYSTFLCKILFSALLKQKAIFSILLDAKLSENLLVHARDDNNKSLLQQLIEDKRSQRTDLFVFLTELFQQENINKEILYAALVEVNVYGKTLLDSLKEKFANHAKIQELVIQPTESWRKQQEALNQGEVLTGDYVPPKIPVLPEETVKSSESPPRSVTSLQPPFFNSQARSASPDHSIMSAPLSPDALALQQVQEALDEFPAVPTTPVVQEPNVVNCSPAI